MQRARGAFTVALGILFVLMSAGTSSYAATVQNCNASALSQCTLTFNLSSGDKVSGSVSVTGGASNDINFYVTNPAGGQIYSAGRVSGGTTFSFTADAAGAYILHFDNSFSAFSSKEVTVSYDVSASGGGIPEFPIQLGFGLLATVLIVTSYVIARRVTVPRL